MWVFVDVRVSLCWLGNLRDLACHIPGSLWCWCEVDQTGVCRQGCTPASVCARGAGRVYMILVLTHACVREQHGVMCLCRRQHLLLTCIEAEWQQHIKSDQHDHANSLKRNGGVMAI